MVSCAAAPCARYNLFGAAVVNVSRDPFAGRDVDFKAIAAGDAAPC